MEEKTNKFELDQEVYVVSGNKLVRTNVSGFKKNNNGIIEYSLKGYNVQVSERLIFASAKDCFKDMEDNIATPESIPKKISTGLSSMKDKLFNK